MIFTRISDMPRKVTVSKAQIALVLNAVAYVEGWCTCDINSLAYRKDKDGELEWEYMEVNNKHAPVPSAELLAAMASSLASRAKRR